MLGNVGLVGPVVNRLGEFTTIYGSALGLMLSYLAISVVTTYRQILMVAVPIALASALLYTVQGSVLSKVVDASNSGTAMSLSHASRSACGVVAPMIGGYVMKYHGGFEALS